MVLKVQLSGLASAKIELVSVKKIYINDIINKNFMYNTDEINDFVIWSTQDFIFNERQLRLPDNTNIKKTMVHTHKFIHDQDRHDCLKKMYDALNRWSKTQDFVKFNKTPPDINKLLICGDYWFVT